MIITTITNIFTNIIIIVTFLVLLLVLPISLILLLKSVRVHFAPGSNGRSFPLEYSRKGLQLLSSFLYYFSLSYLDRPSMGAEVGRFGRFVFLFLALFCQAFCFCFFWDSNFLDFLKLIDSC